MIEQKFTFKKTAFLFFVFIGAIHILTGLLSSNGYLLPISNLLNKILDIPFAMTGILYGFTAIEIQPNYPHKKMIYALMLSFSALIFIGLIYINLFLPDRVAS